MLQCYLIVEEVWNSEQIEVGLIYWRFPQLSSRVGNRRIDWSDWFRSMRRMLTEGCTRNDWWIESLIILVLIFFFPLSLPSSLSLPTHPPSLAGPPTAHYTPLLPSRPIADWGGVSIESLLIGLNADRLKALSLFSLSSLSHAGGLELHGGFRKESELLAQFVGGDGLVFFILTLRTDTHCSTVCEQVAVLAF